MERGKQSSSSFTSDLFEAKDSSSSSKILNSIFAPPAQVSDLSENEKKNNGFETQPSTAKTALGEKEHNWNKDKSSYSQKEETMPFHYSSSIYYGGQDDIYTHPQSSVNPGAGVTTFDKGVGEDDSNSTSRGNWWQGSLYY